MACDRDGVVASDVCAICLLSLVGEQVAVCADAQCRRVCPHYFHHACLMRVRPRACPQCRAPFQRSAALPDLGTDPEQWGRLVARRDSEALNKKEFTSALLAYVCMPAEDLDSWVTANWPLWAQDRGNGAELPVQRIALCTASLGPWLPYIADTDTPVEDKVDDDSNSNQDLNIEHQTEPGAICFCGCVHVFRGDRVKRGAAWREGCEDDGGADHLGSVVRCNEESGNVSVHWDKDPPGVHYRYAWPGAPELNELKHVAFKHVPDHLQAVQQQTHLSSAALLHLIRRLSKEPNQNAPAASGVTEARLLVAAAGVEEEELRTVPNLYQRCRLLPDEDLIHRWYECTPGSNMNQNNLGIVKEHLGREGYVLKVDNCNRAVLVEMAGRCDCSMWLPQLAVEMIYDPDAASPPRFAVGHRVKCLTCDGWKPGAVKRICYREAGWGNRPTAPYQVILDNGALIYAQWDDDRLIRSA